MGFVSFYPLRLPLPLFLLFSSDYVVFGYATDTAWTSHGGNKDSAGFFFTLRYEEYASPEKAYPRELRTNVRQRHDCPCSHHHDARLILSYLSFDALTIFQLSPPFE